MKSRKLAFLVGLPLILAAIVLTVLQPVIKWHQTKERIHRLGGQCRWSGAFQIDGRYWEITENFFGQVRFNTVSFCSTDATDQDLLFLTEIDGLESITVQYTTNGDDLFVPLMKAHPEASFNFDGSEAGLRTAQQILAAPPRSCSLAFTPIPGIFGNKLNNLPGEVIEWSPGSKELRDQLRDLNLGNDIAAFKEPPIHEILVYGRRGTNTVVDLVCLGTPKLTSQQIKIISELDCDSVRVSDGFPQLGLSMYELLPVGLLNSLSQHPAFHELNLRGHVIDEPDLLGMCSALEKLTCNEFTRPLTKLPPKLHTLETRSDLQGLHALQANDHLRTLHLFLSQDAPPEPPDITPPPGQEGDDSAAPLMWIIGRCAGLECLNLECYEFGQADATYLVETLGLKELSLSFLDLEDRALKALGRESQLQELRLASFIEPQTLSVEAATALAKLPALERLVFLQFRISPEAAKALSTSRSLKKLDLLECEGPKQKDVRSD